MSDAAAAFSLGVDQILACWTGNMLQTDGTSGENTSYNSTLPDLRLARSATLLSPAGPIRTDQGLLIPAVNVPGSSSLNPSHWTLAPTPELGHHTSIVFDEFGQLPGSTEAIEANTVERITNGRTPVEQFGFEIPAIRCSINSFGAVTTIALKS